MSHSHLPPPSQAALAHSQRLVKQLIAAITESGGALPFSEFMNQALYTPGLGYYNAGWRKFGSQGDFVTAPEISPLFSQCIAKQCQPILMTCEPRVILEFGAGSGIMAAEILLELARLNCLPNHYFILEVSAELRQRQQTTLQTRVPKWLDRVHWLDRLPTQPFCGVILANEVLDAMPVHRFRLDQDTVAEFYVSYQEDQFIWQVLPTTNQTLQNAVESLRQPLPLGYISEINLVLPAWLQAVADSLLAGLILLIDYGFPQREYYHPQRHQGTLMCHYQHYAHDDPLILVGLQDITAHVDFTAVAQAATTAGLTVAGYTNQANFLLASGLTELLSHLDPLNTPDYLQQTQAAKTLILPSEMGELVKVMALTRHWEQPLQGWVRDDRIKL
jgi:SAM-dependent MidA family methyltransferase